MKLDLSVEERNFIVGQLKMLKNKTIRNTFEEALLQKIAPFVEVLVILTNRYETIAANPPYMGQKNMNGELKQYVNKHYPISKSDLFAVFMEVCLDMNISNGLMGMINQHSWMFLSSYENLREEILNKYSINSMLHLGPRTFAELSGEVVQSTAFVLENSCGNSIGTYFRLTDYRNNTEKEISFLGRKNQYTINQFSFYKIPGSPIAYWVGQNTLNTFNAKYSIDDIAPPRIGMMTTDNKRFLRSWFEVSYNQIGFNCRRIDQAVNSSIKWFPYNKGGGYKKWYGNKELIINWQHGGKEISENGMKSFRGKNFYFNQGVTWSDVSSSDFACRYTEVGHIFDIKGSSSFPKEKELYKVLGLQNSIVSATILNILNPTLSYQSGDIRRIPYINNSIESKGKLIDEKVLENINISIAEWDSRETSWNFKKAPLVDESSSLKKAFLNLGKQFAQDFFKLHKNEEELNHLFIEIYGLQEELVSEVSFRNITILQDELNRIELEKLEPLFRLNGKEAIILPIDKSKVMKQLVSYAVGCMMGRYRLDQTGLQIAHPNPTAEEVCTYEYNGYQFEIDDDAIIPLMGSYCIFPDDAVNRFNNFLELVWGADTLTENKNFLEECLDQEIEKYLLKYFWKDHCKTYKKKPIYWLFSSEKGAFQVLVYMHRMNRFTVEKIRSKYLLKHLQYLQQEIDLLGNQSGLSREEQKRLDTLRIQDEECKRYELLLKDCADKQIEFDLDDGVTENYKLFGEVVRPIK